MTRPDQREAPLGVRRLTGLGLIPDPPGWVPDQPRAVAEPQPWFRPEPEARPDQPSIDEPRPQRTVAPPGALSIGDLVKDAVRDRVPPWADGLVERITVGGLLWALAGLLAIGVAAAMYVHRHVGSGGSNYAAGSSYSTGPGSDSSTATTPAPVGSSTTGSIVVDVGGKVRKPGLVTLPAGARVADAITAAGGPLRSSELDRVDLAARVTDGQLLLVGVKGAAAVPGSATGGTDPSGSPAPISLSDAPLEQLETLPGVGPVNAQKIIDWRAAHGGFTSVSQLQQIPGIGPAHYAEISPLVAP